MNVYEIDYSAVSAAGDVALVKVTEVPDQGPPGPPGNSLASIIDDSTPQPDKAYSGQKTEERLSEDVGEVDQKLGGEEFNFALIFENQIV